MMTPTSDDSSTSPSDSGSQKLQMELPNAIRPSNMTRIGPGWLRQPHVEELLEHERDDAGGGHPARERDDEPAHRLALGSASRAPKQEHERSHEQRRAEPERQPASDEQQ